MIKGAIFDIDGTILDSMYVWEQAGELFLLDLGIVAEPDLSKKLSNKSMLQGAEFIKERYSLKLNVRDIINGINRTIKDFYYYNVQLKKGVERLLKAMQESGIKIVAATASDRRVIEKASLGRLKIIDYFDRLFMHEIGAVKMSLIYSLQYWIYIPFQMKHWFSKMHFMLSKPKVPALR